MVRAGARRRRTPGFVAALLVVLSGAAPGPFGPPAAGQEIDCLLQPRAAGCDETAGDATTTTTDGDVTTTTDDESTTTTEEDPDTTEEPATTERETTTSERRTTTTEAEVVTTASTVDVTTSQNLLVPGDGTEGAESTTTTQTPTTVDSGPSDGTLVALVIGGLIVVALLVAVLTWRYWAATRPAPARAGDGPQHAAAGSETTTAPLPQAPSSSVFRDP